ncbi:hypothetical protein [Natronorubrum halophilum]|uniref:hypothetical protein n=1 Tax=Natronorubrum halophilum TaxID=1702106 RepID=UPI0010C1A237|nr:hypothetical protein [Natronorubrum halophilum]
MTDQRIFEIILIGSFVGGILMASVFIAGEILLWFSYAVAVFSLYLAWRLVRAIEQVAESM